MAAFKNNKNRTKKIYAKITLPYCLGNDEHDQRLLLIPHTAKECQNRRLKVNGSDLGFADTYGEVFNIVNRSGPEAIYTVQYSVNDGLGCANVGKGEFLNFAYTGSFYELSFPIPQRQIDLSEGNIVQKR